MLIDLIIEIISLIISIFFCKAYQLVRFVFNTNIKYAARCIRKTRNRLQPPDNIISI